MTEAEPDPMIRMVRQALAQGLVATVIVGLTLALLWYVRPDRKTLFPPSRRPRRMPWTGAEVLLTVTLVVIMHTLVFWVLQLVGFFRWQYGTNPTEHDKELFQRCGLWATVVAAPLAVVAIVAAVRYISGTKWRHLGLTRWRWLPSLSAGFLFWLLLAPPVFGLHLFLVWTQTQLGLESKEHALQQILAHGAKPVEWALVVFVAVVAAPVLEELVFRGLLQPWLAIRPWRWLWAWGGALGVTAMHGAQMSESWLPAYAVLVLGGVGALATAYERGPRWPRQAIVGSSLLFAASHADAWPAPVPLLFLALGLGWLAYRTRSLIAPIVLHALFNSVSAFVLLMGWLPE